MTQGLHVAIIMDGNGRWAARRGLPRVAGHRAGVLAVRRIVERAPRLDIRRLTLYTFSSDNWKRPTAEVEGIFWLLRAYLRLETDRLLQNGVRLEIIGRRDRLPALLLRDIARAEHATASGDRLSLRLAVDYSSRDAISRAVAGLAADFPPNRLCPNALGRLVTHALSAETGEVDLLVRTGGEKRLSDFLLWESAYAELFFSDRMWPDFATADLDMVVREFRQRERRHGALPEPKIQRGFSEMNRMASWLR